MRLNPNMLIYTFQFVRHNTHALHNKMETVKAIITDNSIVSPVITARFFCKIIYHLAVLKTGLKGFTRTTQRNNRMVLTN